MQLLQSGTCQAGVPGEQLPGWVVSCTATSYHIVLVQQRAAPTLICASKSQVRKHTKMCALSIATTPRRGMVWYGAELNCLRDPVNVNANQLPCKLIQTTHEDPCPVRPLCFPIFVSAHVHHRTSYCALAQGKNAHCQPSTPYHTHAHLHAR